MTNKYLVEVRDKSGRLDHEREKTVRLAHPYLFLKQYYTIDELCYYASYGQGGHNPMGPRELPAFMASIGASYRIKYW